MDASESNGERVAAAHERAKAVSYGSASKGLRAVVLAGGEGVRLQPFTVNFPKALMPLGDVPIIEVLMRRLVQFGITDITLTLGHLAELIKAYFLHRQEFRNQMKFLQIRR